MKLCGTVEQTVAQVWHTLNRLGDITGDVVVVLEWSSDSDLVTHVYLLCVCYQQEHVLCCVHQLQYMISVTTHNIDTCAVCCYYTHMYSKCVF